MSALEGVGPERGWSWEPAGHWRAAALEACGVRAAFSSRLGGVSAPPFASLNLGLSVGDDEEHVAVNRRRFAALAGFDPERVAVVRQVHGGAVRRAEAPGEVAVADGLCTDRPGLVLAISAADCAAVYLVDALRGAVGLCHAGWRGSAAGIAGRAVRVMAECFGSRPADLVAAVSPSIGPCCYEVAAPVLEAFAGRPGVLRPGRPGHAQLDLWTANRLQLLEAGLGASRIHVAGICTSCQPELLFSHRRDGGRTGRMRAVLWIPPTGP